MKKNRIPGIFRKKYTPKALNKKILKRIHIPKDRDMVRNLFKNDSDGKMEIVREIPNEVLIKLKPLAKSIKKNKGMVSRWKAFIVLFIIASILIFNLFFKDKLLTRAVETGLESIFQAKTEVNGLHLSLINGKIFYQSLSIADADHLKRNLIETGISEFRINVAELLRKHIRIEEMSLTEVKWNTLREDEGSLSESAGQNKVDNNNTLKDTMAILSPESEDFDYKQLLEEQKANLHSLNIINRGNEEIDAFTKRWEGIYSEKEKEINKLTEDILSMESLSPQDIGSIEEGRSMLDHVTEVYSRVDETKDSLLALQDEFKEDKKHLMDFKESVKTAVDDDIAYLGSLMDFSVGDIHSLASDTAENYIRNRWNVYYENGLKAFKVYEKLKDKDKKEIEKKKGLHRDSGRTLSFPGPDNPGFIIEHILLSGGDSASTVFKTEIREITNEPDKLKDPLTFLIDWGSGQSSIKMDGFMDLKAGSETPFLMNIESPENQITLENGVSVLNISSMKSKADISGVAKVLKDDNAVISVIDISLTNLQIEQTDKEGFLSKTLKEILADLNQIDLNAKVTIDRDGIKDVRVQSDFDDILSDRVGVYVTEMAGEMSEELRNNLIEYLSPYLDENNLLQSAAGLLDVESLDQISSVNDLEKVLDKKTKELENMTDEITANAQKLIDEKAAQARAEADKIKVEADKAKEEAEKKAQDEAARAKAEAEKKAQDEASKLIDQAPKLKLPGF